MKKYIGCSGFHYDHWKGTFYPEELPEKDWLEYYARHFNTVEINNTFYNMPQGDEMKKWKKQVPSHFRFTIKANRYFTHLKKLKMDDDLSDSLADFQDTVHDLGDQLGCVLWQLPGNQHKDVDKLESFSVGLDMSINHIFEFRHPSWFDDEVYDILEDNELGYCMLSAPDDLPENIRATSGSAYVRFHGKTSWYDYHYSDDELKGWQKRLEVLKNNAESLYIYFNNDPNAWSVENAKKFKSLLGDD